MIGKFIFPNILQRGIWAPTRVLFWFFMRFKVRGLENIRDIPKGVIFALNHSSELDPIILPAAFPFFGRHFPMFYSSREPSFYKNSGWRQKFYGGKFFKLWGSHTLKSGRQDYEVALENHIEILNEHGSLCVFPEGYVTRDGKLGRVHGGVAYLSWRTGKPIVPVAINGVWKIRLKDFLLRKRHAYISFGKPLYPSELFAYCNGNPAIGEKQNDFSVVAKNVMKIIDKLLKS